MRVKPPEIETPHLTLRLPELKDASAILRFFKENESHFAPFDPTKPQGFYTEVFWKDRIPKHHEAFYADQAVRLYAFSKDGGLIGASQVVATLEFSQISRGSFQACYLGYGIAKKFEGRGLMFETLKPAIDFAFGELNLHRIMANHLTENHRSARLLERLGFVREGVAKDYLRINGRWQDHVLTSLTNSRWVLNSD